MRREFVDKTDNIERILLDLKSTVDSLGGLKAAISTQLDTKLSAVSNQLKSLSPVENSPVSTKIDVMSQEIQSLKGEIQNQVVGIKGLKTSVSSMQKNQTTCPDCLLAL